MSVRRWSEGPDWSTEVAWPAGAYRSERQHCRQSPYRCESAEELAVIEARASEYRDYEATRANTTLLDWQGA